MPLGQRLVSGVGLERVHPHHPVGDPVQPGHLGAELRRGRPGPTRRTARPPGAPRPMPVTPKRSLNSRQPLPESRVPPTSPRTAAAAVGHRRVGVARGQLAGEPGQAGAEGEGLDAGPPGHEHVGEAQQRPGVGLHRAADVAHDHEPADPGHAAHALDGRRPLRRCAWSAARSNGCRAGRRAAPGPPAVRRSAPRSSRAATVSPPCASASSSALQAAKSLWRRISDRAVAERPLSPSSPSSASACSVV